MGAAFTSDLWGEGGEKWAFYDKVADLSYAGYMGAHHSAVVVSAYLLLQRLADLSCAGYMGVLLDGVWR